MDANVIDVERHNGIEPICWARGRTMNLRDRARRARAGVGKERNFCVCNEVAVLDRVSKELHLRRINRDGAMREEGRE